MKKIIESENKNRGEVIIYKTPKNGVSLDVRLEKETVWLTQKQMAELFGKGVPTINEHIKNVFSEKELAEDSVIRKFRITAADGKSYETNFYNLDVIISVGYRVKSLRGTQFRIWATKILKRHLVEGYTINQKRLLEQKNKFQELQETISFLQEKSKNKLLAGQEGEIISLLADYSKSLALLEKYDKDSLVLSKAGHSTFKLSYEVARSIIGEIKNNLLDKKEASDLFGQEYEGKMQGVVGAIYQAFGGKDLYPSIEEKAAHLLYFTIKDHPFVDGNKRIASFLFVYFLDKNKYLYKASGEKKINDNALAVLALLIAVSDAKEKDKMIKITTNLLCN
ncbi:MAG: RhuM family protein [bacterium]